MAALAKETGRRALAGRVYVDPAVFEAEKAQIFRRAWLPVGRAEDWPESGSYKAIDLFGEPVIVVRAPSGELRAFSNVCRHRSARMLEGTGKASAIQCPYHLWTYDLEGTCRAAPYMDGRAEGHDETRLPRVRLETWLGFVFVTLNDDAPPLAEQAGELGAKLVPFGVESWKRVATLHYPSPWNWKLMVENFAESYHVMGAHKTTLQQVWPTQGSEGQPTDGSYLELTHRIDAEAGALTVYTLFPMMMLALTDGPRRRSLLWYDMDVKSEGYFDLTIHAMLPPDAADDAEGIEEFKAVIDVVHREDIPLCQMMQAGAASRYATGGPLSVLEQPVWVFHDYLRRMGVALG